MNKWKWLYPGIGVKRWILLIAAGVILISIGISFLTGFHLVSFLERQLVILMVSVTGDFPLPLQLLVAFVFIVLGVASINISLKRALRGLNKTESSPVEFVDRLYQERVLQQGPRIAALGGGTGLSNLLRGIKEYTSNITAVVTVSDDGGSSGKLRDELDMLPPGDIRNCLVALADAEPLMKELFQYRFRSDGDLVGHSFGNLFIASLTKVMGDFEKAVRESSRVLAIRGEVLPSTPEKVQLGAVYTDGSQRIGESDIPGQEKEIERVFLEPGKCRPLPEALEALKESELILVGPGSLYTSIIPNFLIDGIVEAIQESLALKIYVCNVMTQPGETDNYTVSDHLQAIERHTGENLFDYVIVNNESGSEELAREYEKEGAYPVEIDREELADYNINVVEGSLLTDEGFIRHDPYKLAAVIMSILESR
ncbi:MAG: gluconeogenesis factor YvcK family protein [Halanaerobiaceae bacterium]